MRIVRQILTVAALVASIGTVQAQSEPRTALVIGNSAYSRGPLANPVNDARAMADALHAAGFQVILKTEASRQAIRDSVRQLGDALRGKGGVGLLYFAGYGVQAAGENYLIPVGEDIGSEADLKGRAVTAATGSTARIRTARAIPARCRSPVRAAAICSIGGSAARATAALERWRATC